MAITIEPKSKAAAKQELMRQVKEHAAKHGCVAHGAFLWDAEFNYVEEDVITSSHGEFKSICKEWAGYKAGGQSVLKVSFNQFGEEV